MVSKKFFSNAYNYCIIIFRDKIVQIIMFMMLFWLFVSTIHCSILGRNIELGSFVSCEKTAKIYEISEIRTFPELDNLTLLVLL